jgi:5-formyltetrahydrofolate cyclo-ligase
MTKYVGFTEKDRNELVRQYARTLLWSETDDNGEPLDARCDVDDLSDEIMASLREDVEAFLTAADAADLDLWVRELGVPQIAHDFALTRNGHGAGFWDRFYSRDEREAAGRRLTDVAKSFGSISLYVGDDDEIHTD